MERRLENYLPPAAVVQVDQLLSEIDVRIKVVNLRVTRHGDYKKSPDGEHIISLNATPNPFRFLITLIHEIAHLLAFEKFGEKIKPHGREWKTTFQHLMLPYLRPDIFPDELLPLLARHFKNPKASSSTDAALAFALKEFDPPSNKVAVFEIPVGAEFKLYNGRKFTRGPQRTKRIECIEIDTGRLYLFQPNAEVVLMEKQQNYE